MNYPTLLDFKWKVIMKMKLVAVMALIAFPFIAYAQEKVVPLKYGNNGSVGYT